MTGGQPPNAEGFGQQFGQCARGKKTKRRNAVALPDEQRGTDDLSHYHQGVPNLILAGVSIPIMPRPYRSLALAMLLSLNGAAALTVRSTSRIARHHRSLTQLASTASPEAPASEAKSPAPV
ncbi:hypothetical protein THAOC_24106, partial [Thalassiosira oceanica]